MKLNPTIINSLACPRCKMTLSEFECANCGLNFPVVKDTPVLINDENSLFSVSDFIELRDTTYKSAPNWKRTLKKIIPSINLNFRTKANLQSFFAEFKTENPKVLIIGGAVAGEGFDFDKIPNKITLVETDVAFGERTNLICDAHDLPFLAESFDGVIIQAVLEHILEPNRCVAEIYRILKHDGLVYAETPFMQQVHAGRYDFMRFTHLGHRYLFRQFAELKSGAVCGAGMALAWSYCYFLQSFFTNKLLGQIAFTFGAITGFWLKYFDYFLIDKPSAFDSASGYYFFGQKSSEMLAGQRLIADYRGTIR